MKNKSSDCVKLPQLMDHTKLKLQKARTVHDKINQQYFQMRIDKSNSISKLLRDVRNDVKNSQGLDSSLEKIKKRQSKIITQKENFVNRKQKKLYYLQTIATKQNEIGDNENLLKFAKVFNTIKITEISALQKPPHRTKTAMCYQNEKLYLYGGIGAEQNIKLAEFNLELKKWFFPLEEEYTQYRPTTPICGHSFLCYKGKGYIYGGSSTDVTNQLSIVNLKTYKFSEGQKCKFRRKDHAAAMLTKYMIIHGGVEANETMNSMYYYDVENNVWGYLGKGNAQLPYLSHHSMTIVPNKNKRKAINSIGDISDFIYIFGGKDKKGNSVNTLYKINIEGQTTIVEKIQTNFGPEKRFSCSFHYTNNSTLLLYGGKKFESQSDSQNEDECHQNFIYTFNTEKKQWMKESSLNKIQNRYGMASVGNCGKIYIFGGFLNDKYADANITMIDCWNPESIKTRSHLGTKSFLTQSGNPVRQGRVSHTFLDGQNNQKRNF